MGTLGVIGPATMSQQCLASSTHFTNKYNPILDFTEKRKFLRSRKKSGSPRRSRLKSKSTTHKLHQNHRIQKFQIQIQKLQIQIHKHRYRPKPVYLLAFTAKTMKKSLRLRQSQKKLKRGWREVKIWRIKL